MVLEDGYYPFQCGIDYAGGRGVTTWNLDNQYILNNDAILAPEESAAVTFTCSVPKCYSGKGVCLAVFNAWRNDNRGPATAPIELQYTLNAYHVGGCFLSGVATHGATQAWDLANAKDEEENPVYDDGGANTFIIHNNSYSTIQVDHFRVYRVYEMCNLWLEKDNECDGTDCVSIPTEIGAGTFNSFAVDTPCNLEEHGGLSYTQFHDSSYQGHTLVHGQQFTWTFDFSDYSGSGGGNYLGESICYFNFNEMWPLSDGASDLTLEARLNGTIINTYYLSEYGPSEDGTMSIFPSHDLAAYGSPATLKTGLNTVTLENKSGSVDVKMGTVDAGIDIYRIFHTAQVIDHTPTKPIVSGPSTGTVGVHFTLDAVSYDTESDDLTYAFYWDMQSTGYAYGESGQAVSLSFAYNSSGTRQIAVRSRNPLGIYSDTWSDSTLHQMVIYPACGACEVGCQTGCEVSCQDCQTVCETSTCYNLTVIAYNYSWEEISVGVYIDEEYAGQSGSTIQVAEGGHQLYVEDPSGDCQFSYWLDIGNENPRDISVDDDVEFYAVYYCP